MLVHKKKRVLVLKPRNPEHITATIPTAKTFEYRGATLVAVPHKLDEVRVLRNMGIKAPSPILYYYDWSRNAHTVPKPFFAQTETAAFLTVHPRSFVLSGLGSGKTLSSLWSYDYLRSIGERKRVLVVSTLSTLDRAWGDTIFEHFPHLTFSVLHGSKEKRLKLLNQLVDIYIINHDGLKVIGEAFAERPDIDMVIVDEVSEAARNSQTDRWKSLNEVVNNISMVSDDRSLESYRRAGKLCAEMEFSRIEEILANGLHAYLTQFLDRVNEIGASISREFLVPN